MAPDSTLGAPTRHAGSWRLVEPTARVSRRARLETRRAAAQKELRTPARDRLRTAGTGRANRASRADSGVKHGADSGVSPASRPCVLRVGAHKQRRATDCAAAIVPGRAGESRVPARPMEACFKARRMR